MEWGSGRWVKLPYLSCNKDALPKIVNACVGLEGTVYLRKEDMSLDRYRLEEKRIPFIKSYDVFTPFYKFFGMPFRTYIIED